MSNIIEKAINSIDLDLKVDWNGKKTTIVAHHDEPKHTAMTLVEAKKEDQKKE